MRIPQPFVKLPLTFDHVRLKDEISQFGEQEWRAHPERYQGNSSLILVSTNGKENDTFSAPMKAAPRLQKTPYVRQVMAAFNSVIGRSRLMRLEPGAKVSQHTDSHYFWRNHLRLHIPIITDPSVAFYCNGEMVHMAAGESWTFNNWLPHSVENRSAKSRIHLVIDTVGSAELWRMIHGHDGSRRKLEFEPDSTSTLEFENFQGFPVLPVSEIRADLELLVDDISASSTVFSELKQRLKRRTDDFIHAWNSQWLAHGPTAEGFPGFREVLAQYRHDIEKVDDDLVLTSNEESFKEAVKYTLEAALDPSKLPKDDVRGAVAGSTAAQRPRFDRPVFIVSAPRSGSTLLFETLASNRDLWTLGDESHQQFEGIPSLRPDAEERSNRLTADKATPEVTEMLLNSFVLALRNSEGRLFTRFPELSKPAEVRFLEKTPKNSLRIPFILDLFPDARFIFLFRDAKQNISSMLDSWRSGRYVTYPELAGWPADNPWSHLLIPGWENLVDRSLPEIVAQQWLVTNQIILDDLSNLPPERWCAIEYDSLIADTANQLQRLCSFAQIIFGPRMKEIAAKPLKYSKYTLTPPQPDKWKKNAAELETVIPSTGNMMSTLRALL